MTDQVGVWNGKSIPTFYNATTFRSRLEARWAVFMDQLGVRWFYEYEGFELPEWRYVPDFRLPDQRKYLEIKPRNFDLWNDDSLDARKCKGFMRENTEKLVVLAGSPAEQDDLERWYENPSGWTCGDYHYLWCSCPRCGRFDLTFDGRGGRVCGDRCLPGEDKAYTYDDPRIVSAKAQSMSWRFH